MMTRWILQSLAVLFCGWATLGQSGCGSRTMLVPGDGDEETSAARRKKAQAKNSKHAGQKDARAEDGTAAADFAFPNDHAGRMLAELLPPHRQEMPPSGALASSPRRQGERLPLDRPDLSLPPSLADLPDPKPEPPTQPLRPHMVSAEPPLEWVRSHPTAPARQDLPLAARVRLPSPDIRRPLAIMAQALPDRAALTDPTTQLSRAAALVALVPVRTTPAPFLRINLPDPFEHKQQVKVAKPPDETEVPINVGTTPPPR